VIERSRRSAQALLARPALVDSLVFTLIALSMSVEFIALRGPFNAQLSPFRRKLWFLLVTSIVLSALLRRLAPFVQLAVVTLATFLLILLVGVFWWPSTAQWCMYIATYTVASIRSIRWAFAAAVLGTVATIPLTAADGGLGIFVLLTFLSLAAIAGSSTQAGRKLVRELRQQASILEGTREERIKLAILQERSRVARDLHDMVAHGVTVMVVQAGAARMVAETDPSRSEETLTRVEAMAGEALQELSTLAGSLIPDGSRGDEPMLASGLDGIQSLIERERSTGLDVDLGVEGESRPLDPALEISLYRIAQEALTNVRKHAGGARAEVTIRYLPGVVEVEVVNAISRPAAPSSVAGFGRGLIGIRERAALFGGESTAGSIPGGGFRVLARLPLELVPA
jgi:signal transduction histidine kinase